MFDSYVKVRKSEIRELEKSLTESVDVLKSLGADVDKLKFENEALKKENAYLKTLVDKLATPSPPVITNPGTFRVPNEWPAPQPPYKYDNIKAYTGCTTCGITGANGYVCPRMDCPTKISCHTK